MLDPLEIQRRAKALEWNRNRSIYLALVNGGLPPGTDATEDGFYPVSFHSSMGAAHVTKHKIGKMMPDLDLRVKRVDARPWSAEIQAKRKVTTTDDE